MEDGKMGLILNNNVSEEKIMQSYGLTVYGKINRYVWTLEGNREENALIDIRITDAEDSISTLLIFPKKRIKHMEEKKAKQVKLAPKIEKSKTKQEQIADLEKAYKNKQISLNKYLKQREKLEAEIMQVEDLMNE